MQGVWRSRGLCPHGREPNKCKECGGSAICQHGRQRNTCKECLQKEYAGCAVSHDEDTGLQGRVVVFGAKKHQIQYTDGSIKPITTAQLRRALQPPGTTHCFCICSQSICDICFCICLISTAFQFYFNSDILTQN